jgi:hypothetical protein
LRDVVFFLDVDLLLLDGVSSVIDGDSFLITGVGVSASAAGAGVSTSHGTVRAMPTAGKNFLQPTFLVISGSSFGSAAVSTVSWLSSAAVEMVEF